MSSIKNEKTETDKKLIKEKLSSLQGWFQNPEYREKIAKKMAEKSGIDFSKLKPEDWKKIDNVVDRIDRLESKNKKEQQKTAEKEYYKPLDKPSEPFSSDPEVLLARYWKEWDQGFIAAMTYCKVACTGRMSDGDLQRIKEAEGFFSHAMLFLLRPAYQPDHLKEQENTSTEKVSNKINGELQQDPNLPQQAEQEDSPTNSSPRCRS